MRFKGLPESPYKYKRYFSLWVKSLDSKPKIDYILWLGSSTPAETSLNNSVLGRQEQSLRAKFLCRRD